MTTAEQEVEQPIDMEHLTRKHEVLDHGFVRLVDVMPHPSTGLRGYQAVTQAARVSYGKGTKTVSTDKALCNYLMRNGHNTPFEMVEMKFHARMPMFVARQWIRHRTANVNEYSARYSEVPDLCYVPSVYHIGAQSKSNKQGREEGGISPEDAKVFQSSVETIGDRAYEMYLEALELGVSRELARMLLPVNFYTEWYWKIDFHNLCHFLRLRMNPHAQYEIRVYADAMADIVKEYDPVLYSVFEENRLKGVFLPQSQHQAVAGALATSMSWNTAVYRAVQTELPPQTRAEVEKALPGLQEGPRKQISNIMGTLKVRSGSRSLNELVKKFPILKDKVDLPS